MPFMIEVAAILAGAVEDWEDFGIILALLFVNATIGFAEEWKAQGEVNALRASLKTHASVKRDGTFSTLESSKMVPGDVFLLKGGMVVSLSRFTRVKGGLGRKSLTLHTSQGGHARAVSPRMCFPPIDRAVWALPVWPAITLCAAVLPPHSLVLGPRGLRVGRGR